MLAVEKITDGNEIDLIFCLVVEVIFCLIPFELFEPFEKCVLHFLMLGRTGIDFDIVKDRENIFRTVIGA